MRIAFVMPCVGKKKRGSYVKTWQMEPLAIAVLSALTPPGHEKSFYDDRIEPPRYDERPDLVAINVETYTARRAYRIAAEYRSRGSKVVMGGFHATLIPEEVEAEADSVVVGAAEGVWPLVVADAETGCLGKRYEASAGTGFGELLPDRSIYAKYRYMPVALLETGRGCGFDCDFCSIRSFFRHRYVPREVSEVVREIRALGRRTYFFIDDNLGADRRHLRSLLEALVSLKVCWVGQISLDAANDAAILDLMQASGCMGVLIGFESLSKGNLARMNKRVNARHSDYGRAVEELRKHHIAVYATFLFGYPYDTGESFELTYRFSQEQRFFFTAFNHLVPFPGTDLYAELERSGKLLYRKWWLQPGYRFGDVAFEPEGMKAEELSLACLAYRRKFHSASSLLRRGTDFRANISDLRKFITFWSQGLTGRGDVERRQGLPLGETE